MADAVTLEPHPGVCISWDPAAAAALAGDDAGEPGWKLEGGVPEGAILRVITGATEGGAMLLLAGLRERGAENHDEERLAAAVVTEGSPVVAEEVLLSAQHGPQGELQRVGLELYRHDDDYPLRAAGDVSGASGARAVLDFRLAGESGRALHELVGAD